MLETFDPLLFFSTEILPLLTDFATAEAALPKKLLTPELPELLLLLDRDFTLRPEEDFTVLRRLSKTEVEAAALADPRETVEVRRAGTIFSKEESLFRLLITVADSLLSRLLLLLLAFPELLLLLPDRCRVLLPVERLLLPEELRLRTFPLPELRLLLFFLTVPLLRFEELLRLCCALPLLRVLLLLRTVPLDDPLDRTLLPLLRILERVLL